MAPSLSSAATSQYAIVIDAGSSGSRLQIYSWKDPEAERSQIVADVAARVRRERKGKGKEEVKLEVERETEKALSRLVKVGQGVDGDDWLKRTQPGISTIQPATMSSYLSPLLQHALLSIPPSQHSATPVYLLATAGMRLLPSNEREELLDAACNVLRDMFPFRVGEKSDAGPCGESVRVISGEEEGMWGWVAVNYLMDGFGHIPTMTSAYEIETVPTESLLLPLDPLVEDSSGLSAGNSPTMVDPTQRLPTFGFLDMGGASTQLAFSPTVEELERSHFPPEELKSVTLRLLSGKAVEWPVFVASWLGFGTNRVRERYVESMLQQWKASQDQLGSADRMAIQAQRIQDPCLPLDLVIQPKSPSHPPFVGTGSFSDCLAALQPLLESTAPCPQPEQHCLFAGLPTPHIDFEREDQRGFIGISEYWYTAEQVLGLGGVWDWGEWEKGMEAFCQRNWRDIENEVRENGQWRGSEVELTRLEMQCFKGAWISNVLHEGIGIPRISDAGGNQTLTGGSIGNTNDEAERRARQKGLIPSIKSPAHFQSLDAIGETAVSWTLGKMVIEASKAVKLHGHHNPSLGLSDRWRKALHEGGDRLSDAMHLDKVQETLEGYGIRALWAYSAIGILMLILVFWSFRRRVRPRNGSMSKRRKPSDVGQGWMKSGRLEDGLLRRPIIGGKLKMWMYRLSHYAHRFTGSGGGIEMRRPLMKHQQSAPAALHLSDSSTPRSEGSLYATAVSQPPSPNPNASQFFVPAFSGSPSAPSRKSNGFGERETLASPTSSGYNRSLSHKSSSGALNRSKPRTASLLTLQADNAGGWNDPPHIAFAGNTGLESDDEILRTNSATSVLIPPPNGMEGVLSRNSSRLNLHDMGYGPRPIPRVSTPNYGDDPGGYD